MKIYLTDQSARFNELLIDLMTRSEMVFDKGTLAEKTSSILLTAKGSAQELALDFLFGYSIFPSRILSFRTQWDMEGRSMKVGDTILQQVFIPPVKTFSQKVVFGVRINSIIDEVDRRGFSYVTLEGHVERGESIFTVEKSDTGLIFKIKTFSEPGNLLTRLLGPIFTTPYQTYCTWAAFMNVATQL